MKKLIFFDLDGTLINERYQIIEDISGEVKSCISRGFEIGLCSDTPLNPLIGWATKFGFNGPIIAELGALVYFPKTKEISVTHTSQTSIFSDLRSDFIYSLLSFLPDISIFIGDNTEFIRQNKTLDFLDELFVLVSGYRSESLGFHVRRYLSKEDRFICDNSFLEKITEISKIVLKKKSLNPSDFSVDMNRDYGITIVHSIKTNKRDGLRIAMGKTMPDEVVMVGDSMADFMDDKKIIQFAVGNAKEEYKKRSLYVSSFGYTKGAKDILSKI